jgi:Zn-dependent peptidase ImmA (M78 family)
LHELAHIWLGQTGISGYDSEVDVERFCDAVAARFLLAPSELEQVGARGAIDLDSLRERIGAFASRRKLSRKMVAYNLLRSNIISAAVYRELRDAFDGERATQKDHEKGEGGPDYYIVRRHRVGPGLVGLVKRMVAVGALSTPKAGKVLGVKPTAVDRLVGNNRAA